jgi:hypothetical protein
MNRKFTILFLGISILSGCTATGHLYPIRGPLSTQTPIPVYNLKMKDALKSGEVSVALDSGETGKSRWILVPQDKSHIAAMPEVWDTVYGSGFYIANVLGNRLYAQSTVTTNRSTILNIEFYKPDAHAQSPEVGAIKGVAKDNKDNIYKLTF